MEKLKVKEAIVVEGRDDTARVKEAVEGFTIETHGFGITKEKYIEIEEAYNAQGIIIFTDPDFSGEEIRRKLLKKFPGSKQAFLDREKATLDGDIGIENAKPEDIIAALKKARCTLREEEDTFTFKDLTYYGLEGNKKLREKVGRELGIGYANAKTFLKKLNSFGITKEELEECLNVR
ncbi:MAG: ribonuclease M5 [Clostridia bacterium]|nr:ribonuclease M5 [Clostridia bacterium]